MSYKLRQESNVVITTKYESSQNGAAHVNGSNGAAGAAKPDYVNGAAPALPVAFIGKVLDNSKKRKALLLDAALDYAKRGIYVMPGHEPLFDNNGECVGCSCMIWKRSEGYRKWLIDQGKGYKFDPEYTCKTPGKHPRVGLDWESKASIDPAVINAWWKKHPTANICIAAGPSNLIMTDHDSYKDTYAGTDFMISDDEARTPYFISGGGGDNLLFQQPEGCTYGNQTGELPQGIDIRGHGGLFLAPPSAHLKGTLYLWAADEGLDDLPLAVLPDKIKTLLDAAHISYPDGDVKIDNAAVAASVATVEALFEKFQVNSHPKENDRGGIKWMLKTCVMQPEDNKHEDDDHSAWLKVYPDGRIAAGCSHNRCDAERKKSSPVKRVVNGQEVSIQSGWQTIKQKLQATITNVTAPTTRTIDMKTGEIIEGAAPEFAPEMDYDQEPSNDDTSVYEVMGGSVFAQADVDDLPVPDLPIFKRLTLDALQLELDDLTTKEGAHAWMLAKIEEISGLTEKEISALKIALKGKGLTAGVCDRELPRLVKEQRGSEAAAIAEVMAPYEAAKAERDAQRKAARVAKVKAPATVAVHDGRICKVTYAEDEDTGTVEEKYTPLANFQARIAVNNHLDNGLDERTIQFLIKGSLATGERLQDLKIPATEFNQLDWVVGKWGGKAIIEPGRSTRDMLRYGIQVLGQDKLIDQTTYTHTGWRVINGRRVFLHANGAVGMDGINVDLPGNLSNYRLPTDNAISAQEAMIESLAQLELGPHNVTFTGWALMYLAPLVEILEPAFMPCDEGQSGSLKTTLRMLNLNHFGAAWGPHSTPADWSSTANALEALAFQTKDVPLVIDDLKPSDSKVEGIKAKEAFSRLARTVGNRSARDRLNGDSTLKNSYPARGLVMATSEMGVDGVSSNARLFITRVEKDALDINVLKAAQDKAHIYAYAMRSYIEMIAERWAELSKSLPVRRNQLRSEIIEANTGVHLRLPEAIATIYVAMELAMEHAINLGAIEQGKADFYLAEFKIILCETALAQNVAMQQLDPCLLYIQTIITLLAEHKAQIRGKKVDDIGGNGETLTRGGIPRNRGDLLGAWDGTDVLLTPGAYNAVCRYYEAQGGHFPLPEARLRIDLGTKGYLGELQEGRNVRNARIPGESGTVRVLPVPIAKMIEVATNMGIDFDDLYCRAEPAPYHAETGKNADVGTGGRGAKD